MTKSEKKNKKEDKDKKDPYVPPVVEFTGMEKLPKKKKIIIDGGVY